MGRSVIAAAGGAHGFPAALTSFIGRDFPVREVAGLLEGQRSADPFCIRSPVGQTTPGRGGAVVFGESTQ